MEDVLAVVGAVLVGSAAAVFAYPFAAAAVAPRNDAGLPADERDRKARLRARSAVYRWFEPLAEESAGGIARSTLVGPLQRDLDLVEPENEWRAADYLAIRRLEAVSVFAAAAVFGYVAFDDALIGFVVGLGAAIGYPYWTARGVAARAGEYRDMLQSRLALVADLLALMLEGGSTIVEALDRAADENRGHQIGDELARVRASIRVGEGPANSLRRAADRVGAPDLSELVFMVSTALDRGTPVQDALRDTAERLRLRRIQRLEKLAQEAQVKITAPGLLIMLACLAVITAPFLLSGTTSGF